MSAVERLLSRSSWLAEIVEGLVRAQDPVDFARAVVEEFMVARSQTPDIVSKQIVAVSSRSSWTSCSSNLPMMQLKKSPNKLLGCPVRCGIS